MFFIEPIFTKINCSVGLCWNYLYGNITKISEEILKVHVETRRPGSSVGIATALWAGRSGDRIPVDARFSAPCPDRPWGPPSLLYNRYRVFAGGKERPGRYADPSPPSSAEVIKRWNYTCTPTMGRTACTEPQCLYKGALYCYLTL